MEHCSHWWLVLVTTILNVCLPGSVTACRIDTTTSYGREFIVGFPLNDNIDQADDSADALYLFATPYQASEANVTISFDYRNTLTQLSARVPRDSVFRIRIPRELEASNRLANEKNAIHVSADVNIALYGLSAKRYSSDAFLCFPSTSLDSMYVIASWRNTIDGSIGSPANRFGGFLLVGAQDSTQCTIIPSCPLTSPVANASDTVRIRLNRGETRYICASPLDRYDISGSRVQSDKPVACISSHERATIGYPKGTYNHLVEQNPPVSLLGTEAVITPFHEKSANRETCSRVLAYYDLTRVRIGGLDTVLLASQYIETRTDTALLVTSDKPVLVAQYERTGTPAPSLEKRLGDPFMTFVSPSEQYLTEYTVISPTLSNFEEHWLNITVHDSTSVEVIVDTTPLPDSVFKRVGTSNFRVARIKVSAGVHTLRSRNGCAVLVYGFGIWDGYGYCGGMRTERIAERILDKQPPVVSEKPGCGSTRLSIRDTGTHISGIDTIVFRSVSNLVIESRSISTDQRTASVDVALMNPDSDGALVMYVQDVSGNVTTHAVTVNGMMIDCELIADSVQSSVISVVTLNVRNSGRSTRRLMYRMRSNTRCSLPPSITLEYHDVPSGNEQYLKLYVSPDGSNALDDTLEIVDECGRIKEIPLHVTINPTTYVGSSRCEVPLLTEVRGSVSVVPSSRLSFGTQSGEVRVYSILGTLMIHQSLDAGSELDVGILTPGLYVYSFATASQLSTGTWFIR
jgi:hypothetical protein